MKRLGLMKRKYGLTVYITLFGSLIAIKTGASLGDWTMFGTAVLATFGVADVADKKLNGGTYDERDSGADSSKGD